MIKVGVGFGIGNRNYRVFGWNRNYEGIAVPIPAKHFINGVWLE